MGSVSQSDLAVRVVQRAVDQPLLVGVPRRLGSVGNTELAIDVRQVELDGLLGDPEFLRDLLVGETACECPEDDSLTLGETGSLGGTRRGRLRHTDRAEDV